MPMKYDPDTGIPRYVPDIGEELEEGVTPEPKVITTKSDVFKGDKPLTKEQYEKLRDGPTVANAEHYTVGVPPDMTPEQYDKLRAETGLPSSEADAMLDKIIASAKPAKLDKDVATDEEVDNLEKLARAGTVMHWPELLRLINRLRQAEAK